MRDITGQLPITQMESKSNERGRVYSAHGTLRPFMTEVASFYHGSHTLGKEGDSGR